MTTVAWFTYGDVQRPNGGGEYMDADMMNRGVLWLTHRDPASEIGGAEMMDAAMWTKANSPIRHKKRPSENTINEYDHVVITGTKGWLESDVDAVVNRDFVYWPHDIEEDKAPLYDQARVVICSSPHHGQWVKDHYNPRHVVLNPSWFDTDKIQPANKVHDALWAHRKVGHKGMDLAYEWAEREGAELTVVWNQPRDVILRLMSCHRRFVLLSKIFDTAPRAVMEAQLSGCEPIINDNVGWWDEHPDALRQRIDRADKDFWEVVCNAS